MVISAVFFDALPLGKSIDDHRGAVGEKGDIERIHASPLARTLRTPSSKLGGVVSTLAVRIDLSARSQSSVSKYTGSVKVPPTSVATRMVRRSLVEHGQSCFVGCGRGEEGDGREGKKLGRRGHARRRVIALLVEEIERADHPIGDDHRQVQRRLAAERADQLVVGEDDGDLLDGQRRERAAAPSITVSNQRPGRSGFQPPTGIGFGSLPE